MRSDERLFALFHLLQTEPGQHTALALAARFGVERRSIDADIALLRQQPGVALTLRRGHGYTLIYTPPTTDDRDDRWLAATLDAGGRCDIQCRQPPNQHTMSYLPLVEINHRSEALVQRIATIAGVGYVSNAIVAEYRGYRWSAWTRQCAIVLRRVRPYLLALAPQADIALELAARNADSRRMARRPEDIAALATLREQILALHRAPYRTAYQAHRRK